MISRSSVRPEVDRDGSRVTGEHGAVGWLSTDDATGDGASPRLATLALGDPSGPPTVLVPGLTDGLYPVFDPQGRGLFDDVPVPMDRCRGLVVSYRHPLTGVRSTADLAADLATVLDRRLDRPAVLICHSMGTMVAQHLAATHPELIAGLVLSAPLVAVDARLRRIVERWSGMVRGGRWHDMAADALRVSYTGAELDRRRELMELLEPSAVREELVERHLRLSEACLAHRPPEPLGTGGLPTLVLAGELDPVAPPDHATALAAASPAARLHVLPGLAHGFPEQAPAAFAAFVTSFLGEVAGACASWVGGPGA